MILSHGTRLPKLQYPIHLLNVYIRLCLHRAILKKLSHRQVQKHPMLQMQKSRKSLLTQVISRNNYTSLLYRLHRSCQAKIENIVDHILMTFGCLIDDVLICGISKRLKCAYVKKFVVKMIDETFRVFYFLIAREPVGSCYF